METRQAINIHQAVSFGNVSQWGAGVNIEFGNIKHSDPTLAS
jgi:hypothetical protein